MRRFSAGERRAYEKSNALLGVDFKLTPSSRRKIEDLALWLAEGDRSRVPETRRLVLELLSEAAKPKKRDPR